MQVGLFAPRIAKLGHEVVISCMTGTSGFPTEWEGIPLLPAGLSNFSADVLPEHARRFFGRDPGLLLLHYDAWAIGPEAVAGFATAAWSPVHSDGMSVGDKRFYALSGALPIAYSRFGEDQMRRAGMSPYYIPHGVNTEVFRPLSGQERVQVRRRLSVPEDAFVISVVAANKGTDPPRKAWGEHFAAFAEFHARRPDSLMLIHSLAAAPNEWGLDMRPILANLGIADAVMFSDDYGQITGLYPSDYVAKLIGCSDVFSNPSRGEGFGLGALQAQACGIPVIVGNNTAQMELCAAGWKVACQRYWHHRDEAWWYTPLIPSIVGAMERAYQARGSARLAARARKFAEGYEVDLVTSQYWEPALEMLEQHVGAKRVRPPGRGRWELRTLERDGLRWLARGPHTDDWIAVGHEDALAPVLDKLMPADGVLVDVGAHVGRWALRLAAKAAKVYAVEANPDTAAVLRYHIALNKITNVTVIEAAAWDEHTRLLLEDPNRKQTGGSTRVLEGDEAEGGGMRQLWCEAWPLDTLLLDDGPPDLPTGGPARIDLVKLDVEGADLQALWGMREILARYRPVLFIEDHSIYGYYQHEELLALLAKLGYEAEPFTAHLAGDRQAPYVIARPAGE